MNDVRVTVLMPAYNTAKYITEAIDSVLGQTFIDFELLIVDDGSTDDTVSKIRKYKDSRIRLIECSHQGIANALNKGLEEAKGFYIARFDADDVCYPNRLQIQYDFMQSNPSYILSGSEADYMDMNGEYVCTLKYQGYSDAEIRNLDPSVCPFSHVTVMYHKDEVIASGGYDNNAFTFEDHLLWLKLIKQGKVCNLKQSLVKVRFNPESVTIDEKWRSRSFRKIKHACLRKGAIAQEEGDRLRQTVKEQDFDKMKKAAYYSLIAKKYLWDNHDPAKARGCLEKLIGYYPGKPRAYFLYLLSFLPRKMVYFIYRNRPNR